MTDTPETQAQVTAPGLLLKRARESRNLTVAAIATQMNLDLRIIEALEQGDQARLPAPIFVRGYLRGYARLVGVPEAEVLGAYQMPQETAPRAVGRVSAPLRPAFRGPRIPWRGLLLVGVLIVLGWLGFSHGPQLLRQFTGTSPVADVAAPEAAPASGLELPSPEAADTGQSIPAPVAPMPPAATAPDTDVADQTGALELALPAVPPSPEREAPAQPAAEPEPALPADGDFGASDTAAAPAAAESTPQTAQATPTTETTAPAGTDTAGTAAPAEPAQPTAAAAPGEVRMAFTFNAESWVEVRDAGGNKLLFDLMRKGDSREVSGKAPITAIIGNAGNVELRVNGERFDLAPHSRDDVARLRIESGSAGD